MQDEGLEPYAWSNRAFDRYAAHSHGYDRVIYAVSGSIVFGLPKDGRQIQLKAGDRLDLPRGTVHEACVGSRGVTCRETHKE
jgi:quercetin dioxygenase-like cupin family protein